MHDSGANPPVPGPNPEPWPVPLLAGAVALARGRVFIVAACLLGAILGLALCLRTPTFYRSGATMALLPREKPVLDLTSRTSSVSDSHDAAAKGPAAGLLLPPNPDLYMTLIRSRPVAERLVARFGSRLADAGSLDSDARVIAVRSMISVSSTEEGLLTVTVTANDPDLARRMADAVVSECREASKRIERQLLEQQAGFISEALSAARARLRTTEDRLAAFGESNDLVDPALEADKSMRTWRELELQITSLTRDLARRLRHRTERDPTVIRLRSDLSVLEAERDRVLAEFAGDAPDIAYARVTADWNRLEQELRFQRDLVATLTMREEVFRIRANEPAGSMAIIHPATLPNAPAGPSKKRFIGIGGMLGFLCGCFFAVARDQTQRLRQEPVASDLIDELIRLLVPAVVRRRLAGVDR